MSDEETPKQLHYRVRAELLDDDGDVVGTVDVEGGIPGRNATLRVGGTCNAGPESPLLVATFFLALSNDIKASGHMGRPDA